MERVAVLHLDPAVRATLETLIAARGLAVVALDSVEALAAQAGQAAFALLLVDALTLRSVGLAALQDALHGDRPQARVPVVLLADRDDPALEAARAEAIDELLWQPIDARELALRLDSGLARRRSTDLLAVASHELRSPIHAVVAFLDLLSRSELPPQQREMVEGARTSSRHLVDLVEDLLEHARLGQGPVELDRASFSLRDVVRDATAIALDAAKPGHVSIVAHFEENVAETFRGDGPRVRQILLNLLSNALKFAVTEPVRVHVRAIEGMVELEVADDGPGVPEPAQTLVFEPFRQVDPAVTRRFGGTGLGLAIARSLARRMAGDVRVRPPRDGGSGARFVATLALEPDVPSASGVPEAPVQDERALALVADADPIHRATLVPLLERIGYRVETSIEGVAALLHALEHRPDLVVVDMALPVLGGADVARRLRAADAAMPIVGFGIDAGDAARAAGVEAGLNALLAKPVAPLHLQRALRQATTRPARPSPCAASARSEAHEPSGEHARLEASRQIESALRGLVAAVERHTQALDAAIANQDLGLAADVTRSLRGAVLALNARGLEAVLRDLEQAARAGDREETRRAHEAWRAAMASLRHDVERFLVRTSATR